MLELNQARELSVELRKQAHEHANQLQSVISLIYREKYAEAIDVCAKYGGMPQQLTDQMLDQVTDFVLAARLQDLHAHARRRGVELQLDGTLRAVPGDHLTVIIGNLTANAIDAAATCAQGGRVRLGLRDDDGLHITVSDNGGGITLDPIEDVFTPGRTTKGDGHGYGLALVRDAVSVLGGTIAVRNDADGAVFEVCVPCSAS
jgi:sensor histidine kinase regulating citrate/malate metabolism